MRHDDEGFSGATQLSAVIEAISCEQCDVLHGHDIEIKSSSPSIEIEKYTSTPVLLPNQAQSTEGEIEQA